MNIVLGFKCIDFLKKFNVPELVSSRLNERVCLKKKKKLGVIEKMQHAVFFSTGMQVHLPELPCAHMYTNAYIYYTYNTTHNSSNNHCPYLLATY